MRPRHFLGLGPVFAPGTAWLAIACAVAAVLGSLRLSSPGLWWDEIHAARLALEPWPVMMERLHAAGLAPASFVLQKLFMGVLGSSEVGIRLPSVLAGVGTVALAYWAFRPVLNERLAAAAAWFLALSPQFFLIVRMGRGWALASLVAMFAHGLFVRLAVKRGRPRSWLLYGLATTLLLFTTFAGLCLGIAHGVWALAERHRRPRLWKAWTVAFLGGLLLALPALIAGTRLASTGELMPGMASWPAGLTLLLGYEIHALTASELLVPWHPPGAIGLVAGCGLLLLGSLAAVRRGLGRSVLVPGLAALALAWLVLGLFAQGAPFVGLPARTLYLWPFAAVLLAVGALDPGQPRGIRVAFAAALLACWMVGWIHLYSASHWLNPIYLTPGREVAGEIAARAGPGDLVIADEDSGVPWYLERREADTRLASPLDPEGLQVALADPGTRVVWRVRLARDLSSRVRADAGLEPRLRAWGRRADSRGWLPTDPWAEMLRSRVLGFAEHRYRITLESWRRDADASLGTAGHHAR